MSQQRKRSELIDAFLDGELKQAQAADFVQQQSQDAELSRAVKLNRHIREALKDETVVDFQRKVQAANANYFGRSGQRQGPLKIVHKYVLPAAAAAALLLFATTLFGPPKDAGPALNDAQLYAAYFETYNITNSTRSGDQVLSIAANATKAYNQGDFATASKDWQTLVDQETGDMELRFNLAQAYLNQQTDATDILAHDVLKTIIDDGNSPFIPKAKWYLALLYVKQGEALIAKPLLQDVKLKGGKTYRDKATMLLDQLGNRE